MAIIRKDRRGRERVLGSPFTKGEFLLQTFNKLRFRLHLSQRAVGCLGNGRKFGPGEICIIPWAAPSPTRAASASNGRGLSGTLREMMALPPPLLLLLLLLVILAARTRGGEGTRREGRRRDGSRTPSHCSLCLSSLALFFSLCSDSLSRIKARQKVATDDMDASAAASRPPKLFRQPRALCLLTPSVRPSLRPSLVHMLPSVTSSFLARTRNLLSLAFHF